MDGDECDAPRHTESTVSPTVIVLDTSLRVVLSACKATLPAFADAWASEITQIGQYE